MLWSSDNHYPLKVVNFSDPKSLSNWFFNHPRSARISMYNILGRKTISDRLIECTGSNDTWFVGGARSDFFYIPSRAVLIFLDIVGYFSFHELFVEIAIPTFMNCFNEKHGLLKLKLCNLYDNPIGKNMTLSRAYCENYETVHNVKLSRGLEAIQFVRYFMYERKSKLFTGEVELY